MSKVSLSILVENTSGVLSRVAGLFSRRGYNIDSLTVGVTENPKFSRMTVVASGRELILVKVGVKAEERQQVISIADIFRAKIVDVAPDSMMVELTGNQIKLDAFTSLLEGFEIRQLVRTGITGLIRGACEQ